MDVHELPAAIVPPFVQVPPVFVKSEAFVPEIVKYGVERISGPVPVLLTVTVIGELVVPTV